MDVDKCVELHNKILKHGWLRSGKTIEDFEQKRQTWFDQHGDQAEAVAELLSPDLIAFLEGAYTVDCEYDHTFSTTLAVLPVLSISKTTWRLSIWFVRRARLDIFYCI
jgi:hypothetical protein